MSITTLLLLVLLFLTGCTGENDNAAIHSEKEEKLLPLKIGLMPAVDTAPIFIAKNNGYFEALGLEVELQVFTNAQDRQTALQTGQIDGAMSDVIALIMNVQAGFDIKGTTLTDGMFPILVRSGFQEADQITVAMMEVSVSNYLADMWLSNDYEMEKIFINEIPARLEMIRNGNVDMGVFPEPVASMGELDGLEKRIYPLEDGYCPDIMVFTGQALKEKDASIEAFHRGLDQAVLKIQSDESLARAVLVQELGFNPAVENLMALPLYNQSRLPSDDYFINLMEWTASILGKEINISPEDIIERKYTK